jgi:hypothetical protein
VGRSTTGSSGNQQTLHLTNGAGPISPNNTSSYGGLLGRVSYTGSGLSNAFNNTVPFDLSVPNIGVFDYPHTMIGAGFTGDFTDGTTFTATVYGSTRTYMPGKSGPFANCFNTGVGNGVLCMRYD